MLPPHPEDHQYWELSSQPSTSEMLMVPTKGGSRHMFGCPHVSLWWLGQGSYHLPWPGPSPPESCPIPLPPLSLNKLCEKHQVQQAPQVYADWPLFWPSFFELETATGELKWVRDHNGSLQMFPAVRTCRVEPWTCECSCPEGPDKSGSAAGKVIASRCGGLKSVGKVSCCFAWLVKCMF